MSLKKLASRIELALRGSMLSHAELNDQAENDRSSIWERCQQLKADNNDFLGSWAQAKKEFVERAILEEVRGKHGDIRSDSAKKGERKEQSTEVSHQLF